MRKNNKIIVAVMLIFMVFMSSCKETNTESDTEEANSGDSTNNAEEYDDTDNQEDSIVSVTREYFENVDKEYRLDDIVEEIGEPSDIKNSGIIYYVWDLTDGTEAYVSFSPDEKIETIEIIAQGRTIEWLYTRQFEREYFENVDKNYRLEDILEEIGEPSYTTGSGMTYYVWDLTDGTNASVYFSPYDGKIERIHIIAPDGPDELLYMRQHNN